MDQTPVELSDIASAIRLALAPVFLLTGIAGLLNVMAGRLARIVDRIRALTDVRSEGKAHERVPDIPAQRALERRRHYTSIAITSCTIAALLVCIVIATLFVEVMLGAPLKWLIGGLFTAAMLALVVGLAFFLREVHLAMQGARMPAPGTRG
jgi:hypothetical protein